MQHNVIISIAFLCLAALFWVTQGVSPLWPLSTETACVEKLTPRFHAGEKGGVEGWCASLYRQDADSLSRNGLAIRKQAYCALNKIPEMFCKPLLIHLHSPDAEAPQFTSLKAAFFQKTLPYNTAAALLLALSFTLLSRRKPLFFIAGLSVSLLFLGRNILQSDPFLPWRITAICYCLTVAGFYFLRKYKAKEEVSQ